MAICLLAQNMLIVPNYPSKYVVFLANPISPYRAEESGYQATTTLIRPRSINAKAVYAFSSDTFLTVESSARALFQPPPFNLTYGTRVSPHLTGFVRVSTGSSYSFLSLFSSFQPTSGSPSTLSIGITGSSYSLEVTTNQILQSQFSASYGNIRLFGAGKNGWKISTTSAVTSSGSATLGISTEKRLTENTHVGLGMHVGIGNGSLTLRLRISRLGQRLNIPITISQAASVRMILSTVIIPSISIASLQYFYLTPRKRRRISRKLRELRAEMKEQNEQKRKEAVEARELLREQTTRKREVERQRNGLVILSAIYTGTGTGIDLEEAKASELDVSIPLQAMIIATSANPRSTDAEGNGGANSLLTIPPGRSKASLPGFYDVLIGSKKQLEIEYSFRGRRHRAAFDDYQAVAIPMRSHIVE